MLLKYSFPQQFPPSPRYCSDNKNYFYTSTVFLQEGKNNEEIICHGDANRHKSLSSLFTILREGAGWCPAMLDKSLRHHTTAKHSFLAMFIA